MKSFYNSFSFIVAFLVALLIINMALGNKVTEYFLILVLLSMIFFNIDKFTFITNKLGGN